MIAAPGNGRFDGGLSASSGISRKDDGRSPVALGAMLTASEAKSHPPAQEDPNHLVAVSATFPLSPGLESLLPVET